VLPWLPDSGSSGFPVQSTLLPADKRGNNPVYDPSASDTSERVPGFTFSIAYASGYSDSGDVYTDVVTVGQTAWANVVVGAMTNVSEASSDSYLGNMGLSYSPTQGTSPTPLRSPLGVP
jgi:aspergillopepsin I